MRVVACRPGCLVLPALVEKVTWREKEDELRPTNSMLGVFDTTFFRNLVRNTDCTFTQNWHNSFFSKISEEFPPFSLVGKVQMIVWTVL